jgi:hypothetical protein
MPFTKDLSKPLIWGQERLAGSSRGIRRVHCHGLARLPYPEAIPYFAILQGSGSGCLVEVAINSSRLTASCSKTDWERVKLGTVELSAPTQSVTLRSVGTSPVAKVFSLEIVKPEVQVKLAAQGARGAAPTDWMVQAKYGVMVHWTSQSKPEQGSPLAYCQTVRNFDAARFADVLDENGCWLCRIYDFPRRVLFSRSQQSN